MSETEMPVIADLIAAIESLTWGPPTRDAVSGRVTPPRRKVHVRVRDLDAAIARVISSKESDHG